MTSILIYCTKPQELLICKPLSTTFSCESKLSAADDLECLDSKIKPLSVTAPVFIPSAGSTTLCRGGGTAEWLNKHATSTSI